jgi:hypothetical protein
LVRRYTVLFGYNSEFRVFNGYIRPDNAMSVITGHGKSAASAYRKRLLGV